MFRIVGFVFVSLSRLVETFWSCDLSGKVMVRTQVQYNYRPINYSLFVAISVFRNTSFFATILAINFCLKVVIIFLVECTLGLVDKPGQIYRVVELPMVVASKGRIIKKVCYHSSRKTFR